MHGVNPSQRNLMFHKVLLMLIKSTFEYIKCCTNSRHLLFKYFISILIFSENADMREEERVQIWGAIAYVILEHLVSA